MTLRRSLIGTDRSSKFARADAQSSHSELSRAVGLFGGPVTKTRGRVFVTGEGHVVRATDERGKVFWVYHVFFPGSNAHRSLV